MSTNYYAIKLSLFESFEKEYKNSLVLKYLFPNKQELFDKLLIHIGKYCFNKFTFNNSLGNSYQDIKKELKDYIIFDEYYRKVEYDSLIKLIEGVQKDKTSKHDEYQEYFFYDEEGYRFMNGRWH